METNTKKLENISQHIAYDEWMMATLPKGEFDAHKWDQEHTDQVLARWTPALVEAMCRSAWHGLHHGHSKDRKVATEQIRALMPYTMARKQEITIREEGEAKGGFASYVEQIAIADADIVKD